MILAKFGPTKDEPYIIDIIPFMAGDKMPDLMKVKKDKPAYYLDIYVHSNIGPGKAMIVCPSKNYGEPCPICEHIEDLVRDGKEYDDYAEIAPKRRCVYNIIDQTSAKETKKGIQIWEVSRKYSETPISAAAKNPRGGGSVPFSHPDKEVGQSISFSVDNDTYKTIVGHKLVSRDYDIEDSVLDKAHQLDQIINILSYDDIKSIFSKVGTSKVEDKEEDDIKDPPVPEDVKESKRESRATNQSTEKNVCPGGKVFGEDIDRIPECQECNIYGDCANKADLIEKEKKEASDKARAERVGRRR